MEKDKNPGGAAGASAIIRTWNVTDNIRGHANQQELSWLIHRFGVQMFAPKGGEQ